MTNSLQKFIEQTCHAWGPLTTAMVSTCRANLEDLLQASPNEAWLGALHSNGPANEELYRHPTHGFVLLAHAEHAGLYRPPHDHGRAWVAYAVQRGEVEMCTYARVIDAENSVRLVKRNSTIVRAGQVQFYLPGDIHDTKCLTEIALLFRFTERDLRVEDKLEHQVTRYVEGDGLWTVKSP